MLCRTVLRELLQNASDASASSVTIKFETIPSTSVPVPNAADPSASIKHVLSHHTVKRLLLTNNGVPFTSKDWSRLKRIAEGNPDETKIGAFGVGFYSVFSDCEEPFVSSGKEAMAFYWKGNALFTRRLQLGEADSSPNTSFVLDYRNTTSPVPALMPLCQFLASSLTFVGLETIELWLDDWNVLKLSKKVAPSVSVNIPRDIDTRTDEGMMRVTNIKREVAQIDATCMKAVLWKPATILSSFEGLRNNDTTASLRTFFSRLTGSASNEPSGTKPEKTKDRELTEDLIATNTSSVFLHISTAHIQTSVSQSFARELERATKKPPPKSTNLAILTSSYDGVISSQSGAANNVGGDSDLFASVLPSKSGRIFIGFPTHQTTGLNAHISAPSIIPTVERESIDLNARWVRTWNLELLRAAGVICRVAWSVEMSSLNDKILRKNRNASKSHIENEVLSSILPEAIHTSNQFVFRESTPTSKVGQVIEDSFWTCSKNAYIEVISTCGVLPSHHIRIAPKDLSFMDRIPVLPETFASGAQKFVKRLIDFGLIVDITVSDIKRELESNALSSQQLDEFLAWATKRVVSGEIDGSTIQSLLQAVVANDELSGGVPTRVLVLADIEYFLNPNRIPVDLPIPTSVLPFRYTKSLPRNNLIALGWRELEIDTWIQWLIKNSGNRHVLSPEQDMTQSQPFSSQVLPVLSKQFDSLESVSKSQVVELLNNHTVIPTKSGMKRPSETYFPSVRLFDDLPVVTGLNNVKEKFLVALGVRKTVDLNVIFERLLNNREDGNDASGRSKKWSHVDLIKYLASVRNDIPAADIEKLKNTKICTAESNPKSNTPEARYKVCELFEPNDELRDLNLPLIYWPGRYTSFSAEGKFLSLLGLRTHPSATELVHLMARAASEKDFRRRDKAMSFFVTHHLSHNYSSLDSSRLTVPYLPVENSEALSTPNQCFTDDGARIFGFSILQKNLHAHASKFGVRQHPPLNECLSFLVRNPPKPGKAASTIFEYFAKRLGEINQTTAERISQAAIVPVTSRMSPSKGLVSEKSQNIRHIPPQECYIGESEEYGDLFDFVDFNQEANLFLLACGSKRQPTKVEVASLLVKEPARISSKLQSPEKYLNLLRSIAESTSVLKNHKELFKEMKRAPFLLASRELPSSKSVTQSTDEQLLDTDDQLYEEEQGIKEWQLVRASDAIIVDDYASFSLFKENILAAPQEELLENLYVVLGTQGLSSLVEEQARIGSGVFDQHSAIKLQKQISERSRLFLHDMPRELVRHDSRWLEKHLTIHVVQSISLRRSLRGRNASHVEKRSAVVTQNQKNFVLSIRVGALDYYQISQALSHLILTRPKLHSTLTLEMLLKTDLLELRARGYNVERILRQKAAEARMAENRRQEQLEEERKQIQEKELQWRKGDEQTTKSQNEPLSMPGVFPDAAGNNTSPEQRDRRVSSPTSNEERGFGNMFSNFTRRIDEYRRGNNTVQSALQNLRGGTNSTASDPPPPYSTNDPREPQHDQPHNVTSPHKLQSNLLSAIQACRPHGSSTVYNRGEKDQVEEKKSYCDERPGHDLVYAADVSSGIKIFVVKQASQNRSAFLAENSSGLNAFSSILIDCASIFAVRRDSVSMFFEPEGKTIAFNSQGSLFCNYFYFQQLHQTKMLQGGNSNKEEALVYWWVILCHELAHNLVSTHSAEHSFYT